MPDQWRLTGVAAESHFPPSLQEKLKETLADLEAANPKYVSMLLGMSLILGGQAFLRNVGPSFSNLGPIILLVTFVYVTLCHHVLAILL